MNLVQSTKPYPLFAFILTITFHISLLRRLRSSSRVFKLIPIQTPKALTSLPTVDFPAFPHTCTTTVALWHNILTSCCSYKFQGLTDFVRLCECTYKFSRVVLPPSSTSLQVIRLSVQLCRVVMLSVQPEPHPATEPASVTERRSHAEYHAGSECGSPGRVPHQIFPESGVIINQQAGHAERPAHANGIFTAKFSCRRDNHNVRTTYRPVPSACDNHKAQNL